ncbi:ADP-ribosylation factor-like protein 6-interacting protein 4 [Melitaea cinxia]|uniref:ADP-ribosylation factor-like protein 6-interacting protein 4 n=1 Tax=Melitaea cinxia TaxID=113334 RepID=UPI001E270B89|nr:ADP-ribosylation factor-like protein 6-interacting protein 4 [Melitaea cinxia]XP_045449164.1 ADP-ribosylation factor-like protein 6-interacting protein 4 [Melitaea cinxia]
MGKEKSKKRRRSTSSSSSSSDSSREKKKLRKLKKKLKREQKKTEKILKKKLKEERKKLKKKKREERSPSKEDEHNKDETSADIPLELMERSKAMAPMTKEEWEKRQSVIRRVQDEETGRYRLIKGDGEVLEEIVSRDRHLQINRRATMADGDFFQSQTIHKQSTKTTVTFF